MADGTMADFLTEALNKRDRDSPEGEAEREKWRIACGKDNPTIQDIAQAIEPSCVLGEGHSVSFPDGSEFRP